MRSARHLFCFYPSRCTLSLSISAPRVDQVGFENSACSLPKRLGHILHYLHLGCCQGGNVFESGSKQTTWETKSELHKVIKNTNYSCTASKNNRWWRCSFWSVLQRGWNVRNVTWQNHWYMKRRFVKRKTPWVTLIFESVQKLKNKQFVGFGKLSKPANEMLKH